MLNLFRISVITKFVHLKQMLNKLIGSWMLVLNRRFRLDVFGFLGTAFGWRLLGDFGWGTGSLGGRLLAWRFGTRSLGSCTCSCSRRGSTVVNPSMLLLNLMVAGGSGSAVAETTLLRNNLPVNLARSMLVLL